MSDSNNNFGRYIRYAFGEIILVVIGILIALYIKGWYQENEEMEQLDEIAEQIIDDLRRDTADVTKLIDGYEPLRKDYLGIINRTYTLDSLKNCNRCAYLISSLSPFVPSQNGYTLLKEWRTSFVTSRDSLIHDTKFFYEATIPTMELLVEMLKEDVKGNLNDWRDNHEWYAYWASGVRTDEFYDYMATDPIFRNKVANFYLLLYRNYVVGLHQYRFEAAKLADRWEKEIAKDKSD